MDANDMDMKRRKDKLSNNIRNRHRTQLHKCFYLIFGTKLDIEPNRVGL